MLNCYGHTSEVVDLICRPPTVLVFMRGTIEGPSFLRRIMEEMGMLRVTTRLGAGEEDTSDDYTHSYTPGYIATSILIVGVKLEF